MLANYLVLLCGMKIFMKLEVKYFLGVVQMHKTKNPTRGFNANLKGIKWTWNHLFWSLHISGKTEGDNVAPSGMEQKAINFYQNQLA